MAYDRKDHFYRRAKKEKKASRAVYKLAELQRRFKIIKKGDIVVDLGSAPGGWLQELSPMVGPQGKVIGIDLLPLKISTPKYCAFVLGDITDESSQKRIEELAGENADVIVSDMSPNLSGIAFADSFRSFEVATAAFDFCAKLLKTGGNFVAKIFPGPEFDSFISGLKKEFKSVSLVVPEATRKTSSERYIVAIGYKTR